MNLDELSDDELRSELERREAIAKHAAIPKPKPHELIDLTELIRCCESITDRIANENYNDSDNDHWIYEAAIEAIYGKEYWTWRNKIG